MAVAFLCKFGLLHYLLIRGSRKEVLQILHGSGFLKLGCSVLERREAGSWAVAAHTLIIIVTQRPDTYANHWDRWSWSSTASNHKRFLVVDETRSQDNKSTRTKAEHHLRDSMRLSSSVPLSLPTTNLNFPWLYFKVDPLSAARTRRDESETRASAVVLGWLPRTASSDHAVSWDPMAGVRTMWQATSRLVFEMAGALFGFGVVR